VDPKPFGPFGSLEQQAKFGSKIIYFLDPVDPKPFGPFGSLEHKLNLDPK
jgi:hypothetical protein